MKGIRALEYVGRETLDILAAETGFELENDEKLAEEEGNGGGESFTEEVTFDRCFYIYGGPEHLEVRSPIVSETCLYCLDLVLGRFVFEKPSK